MAKIKVTGLDKLQKALKENVTMQMVKDTVKNNGIELRENIKANADFKMGYQTGTTKRSVCIDPKDGGFTVEVGPETEYAPCSKIGRSIWQHMLEDRAKSVKIFNWYIGN